MNRPKILVVGDVMLDHYVFGEVARISPEAPIPILSATREEYRPGGAGNVAMNLRALGCDCTLMSVTGRDHAQSVLSGMLGGIDKVMLLDDHAITTMKTRAVSGQHLLRIDREERLQDSRALRDMAASFAEIVSDHDAVIMSDYDKGVLSDDALTTGMVRAARRANVPVFVDPRGTNFSRYEGTTVITPNMNELRAVTGQWESEAQMLSLADDLRNRIHARALLLTRGDEGMTLLMDDCAPITIPTVAQEVFDVSGAGDTVVAAFATMFVRGHSFFDSADAANRAAGIVVGKRGTATASWAEIWPAGL